LAVLTRPFAKGDPALLCTSHGGDLYGLGGFLFDRLKSFVLNRIDGLTVVSQAMRTDTLSIGADAPEKISVIPMGVDLKNQFVPLEKRQFSSELLFVGRLVEKKGARFLLEALPSILKEYPAAKLTVVGDGQEKGNLIKLTADLGIQDQVRFVGPVANSKLPGFYQHSDIVIFPSVVAADGDREGFGLVVAEALGCTRAVVVTDLPAMQDIVTNGKTALVVPQKSARHLAEAVNRLLKEPELARRLGQAGRDSVVSKFDWDVIASKYIGLIEALTPPAAK
jgi:glycosyltransferase involved in cell wall biosynthesis